MKCLVCGNELPETAQFCNSCGARVVKPNQGENVNLNNQQINNLESESINNQNVQMDSSSFVNQPNIGPVNNDVPNVGGINNDVPNLNQTITNDPINMDNTPNINQPNMDQPNVFSPNNNINEERPVENKKEKRKKSKLPIILTIAIILVIAAVAIILWLFVFNKKGPKEVFTNFFKTATSKLLVDDSKKYDTISSKFDLAMNFSSTDTTLSEIFDVTNKVGISGAMQLDYKNKLMNVNLKLDYDDDQFTNLILYGENNNMYMYLDGLYDKYIKTEVDMDDLYNTNNDDLNTIKESLDKAFNTALKDDYLSQSKETIKVNGKDKKVTSSVLTIDKSNSANFFGDFFNTLANDDKFVNVISKLNGTEASEVKSELKEVEATFEGDEKLVISIYTEGVKNDFVGVNGKTTIDGETVEMSVIKNDESNYDLIISNGIISYTLKLNITESNDTTKYVISANDGTNKIEITLNESVKYNETIEKLDVTNSIDDSLLTDADLEKIQSNLQNNTAFKNIAIDLYQIPGLSSLFGGSSTGTGSDYDYDLDTDYDYDLGTDYNF